jgi:hypothetical protein
MDDHLMRVGVFKKKRIVDIHAHYCFFVITLLDG